MKKLKRIAALVLMLTLVLALTVSASAAGTGTITVANPQPGQTYTAYKIFDVSYNADKSAYSYTIDSSNEWVLKTYRPLRCDRELFSKFTIYTGQKAGQIPIPEKSKLAARVFSAANKFATLRELQMLKNVNEPERLAQINHELQEQIQHTGNYIRVPIFLIQFRTNR